MNQCARPFARVASPNAPLVIPMSVIPTWMVERKCEGSVASASAVAAPPLPSSASCCRRALREETTAISDIANKPFSTISDNRMIRSIGAQSREVSWLPQSARADTAVQRCAAASFVAGAAEGGGQGWVVQAYDIEVQQGV